MFTPSDLEQANTILNMPELGDDKPSALMSYIGKLRKPETVGALTAMSWFTRTLPDAQALL